MYLRTSKNRDMSAVIPTGSLPRSPISPAVFTPKLKSISEKILLKKN